MKPAASGEQQFWNNFQARQRYVVQMTRAGVNPAYATAMAPGHNSFPTPVPRLRSRAAVNPFQRECYEQCLGAAQGNPAAIRQCQYTCEAASFVGGRMPRRYAQIDTVHNEQYWPGNVFRGNRAREPDMRVAPQCARRQ